MKTKLLIYSLILVIVLTLLSCSPSVPSSNRPTIHITRTMVQRELFTHDKRITSIWIDKPSNVIWINYAPKLEGSFVVLQYSEDLKHWYASGACYQVSTQKLVSLPDEYWAEKQKYYRVQESP